MAVIAVISRLAHPLQAKIHAENIPEVGAFVVSTVSNCRERKPITSTCPSWVRILQVFRRKQSKGAAVHAMKFNNLWLTKSSCSRSKPVDRRVIGRKYVHRRGFRRFWRTLTKAETLQFSYFQFRTPGDVCSMLHTARTIHESVVCPVRWQRCRRPRRVDIL